MVKIKLSELNDRQLIKYMEAKIAAFGPTKEDMEDGVDYYNYKQAIDNKTRAVIGKDGKLVEVRNLPNTRIKDNQYARAVDQKRNYLLSETPNIDSKNDEALSYLTDFFDSRFMRTLNDIARDYYNCGISWLFVSTDGHEIDYKRIDPKRVIPLWKDDNHDSLEALMLFVAQEEFEGENLVVKHYVYLYMLDIIKVYEYNDGHLKYIEDEAYLKKADNTYDYRRIPFVYFKQPGELPLINKVRCLQDALNLLLSNYADNLFQNPMNSILVLKNYDGEDLGEFREKLAQYGTVKVRTVDGAEGGLETLTVEVNSENYKIIIELIKEAIAHNARSLYLDNNKNSNTPNTLNIKAMYSDMELDANDMELEFTASFDYLFDFIGQVTGIDFSDVDINFKRNIMVNDESMVEMIRNSVGIVSDETLRASHPLVQDSNEEEKRIKKQADKDFDLYNQAFKGV